MDGFRGVLRWVFGFDFFPAFEPELLDKRRRSSKLYLFLMGWGRRAVALNCLALLYQYLIAVSWVVVSVGLAERPGEPLSMLLQLDRSGVSVLLTFALAYGAAQMFIQTLDRIWWPLTRSVMVDHGAEPI